MENTSSLKISSKLDEVLIKVPVLKVNTVVKQALNIDFDCRIFQVQNRAYSMETLFHKRSQVKRVC